jgi:hypothetical protein
VCLGRLCKPLGPKLSAVIADPDLTPRATTDLKAVIVVNEVWNVAKDKRLDLRPPRAASKTDVVRRVDVAGEWLVVHFADCAGPCAHAWIFDANGKTRSTELGGGGKVIGLDDEYFAVVSEYSAVDVISMKAGKLLGERDGADIGDFRDAVRLDDDSLATLRTDAMGSRSRVTIVFRGSGNPWVQGDMFLPSCGP